MKSNPAKAAGAKRHGRGVNQTGRSKRREPFVMLPISMLKTAAWRTLGAVAQALYVALRKRYNGCINGKIGLSVREAASVLHIAKDTASNAFRTLEDRGFIRAAQRGDLIWKRRHSTTWALTDQNFGDELPTKEFARWVPLEEKVGPKRGTACPNPGTIKAADSGTIDVSVPDQGPKTLN